MGYVFRVHVTGETAISQVLAFGRGENMDHIPIGPVARGTEWNSPEYSWHMNGATMSMTAVAIELCDASPAYVEEVVDQWIAEVGQYWPWSGWLKQVSDCRSGVCQPMPNAHEGQYCNATLPCPPDYTCEPANWEDDPDGGGCQLS